MDHKNLEYFMIAKDSTEDKYSSLCIWYSLIFYSIIK